MNLKNLDKFTSELGEEIKNFGILTAAGEATETGAISIMKKEVEVVMAKIIKNLYYILKDHPITTAQSMMGVKTADEPETLREYYDNMILMKGAATKLKKPIEILKKDKDASAYLHSYIKSREDFEGFSAGIIEFTSIALNLIEQASKKADQTYLRMLNQGLTNMSNALKRASQYVYCWEKYGENYVEIFNGVQEFFDDTANLIKGCIADVARVKKAEAEMIAATKKTEPVRVVKVEQDEKTITRLAAIKEANDLYDRFQVDFMRDLQKEVSMMNRDMYEALIDKVERFLKRFPMPLSNDVSVGMAIEAQSQINKFIESVYEISRNTYSPVVFGG